MSEGVSECGDMTTSVCSRSAAGRWAAARGGRPCATAPWLGGACALVVEVGLRWGEGGWRWSREGCGVGARGREHVIVGTWVWGVLLLLLRVLEFVFCRSIAFLC